MATLSYEFAGGRLNGEYDPRFSAVVDTFKKNFTELGEVGASLCLSLHGETVVDLWGGLARASTETPWERDTVSVVYSSTKGAVALAAHTLISQGKLDLEAPVGDYWPEFASNGKESATVRMMLNHSAGVPANREKLPDGAYRDWDFMVDQIAQEAPFWTPGTRNGYHMMTFGWTVGELIRRVTNQSLGSYFAASLAQPLGAEFWIGLPDAHLDKVAPMIAHRPEKGAPIGDFTKALLAGADTLQSQALFNNGGFNPNEAVYHKAEIGGGGGISNGRGLATIYAPFANGGCLDGKEYVTPSALARMSEVSVATGEDATLLIPTRFGLGFMKSMDNRARAAVDKSSVVLSASAFGHVGAGGSIGFADPAAGLSFGYSMNKMGPGILLNERGQGLVDATYEALGYVDDGAGVWHRNT